jgi:cobyrinic acid a,c-diamide synthase
MQQRLSALGPQQLALPTGSLRGHTFHYSRCESTLAPARFTASPRGNGEAVYQAGSLQASYFHAWFASSPQATASLFLGAQAA